MNSSSVKIVLRKDKKNTKGLCPINLRIIVERKIKYKSTGYSCTPEDWNVEGEKLKKSYPNHQLINNRLNEQKIELSNKVIQTELFTVGKVEAKDVFEGLNDKPVLDFVFFAYEHIANKKSSVSIGTHDKNLAIMAKLEGYLKNKLLPFNKLNYDFLVKYEDHLRTHHKNKTNTVGKDLKFFKSIILEAVRRGMIDYIKNPFIHYKIKNAETEIEFLSNEELEAIKNVQLTTGTKKDVHRDVFVFNALGGGLRIGDTFKLKWSNIKEEHIVINAKKGGKQLVTKISKPARVILEKYRPLKTTHNSFVFPVLEEEFIGLDEENQHKIIKKATSHLNKNLGLIAKKLELNRRVTSHMARHTFATKSLTLGVAIETVSSILGHSSIKQTQQYAKVVNSSKDDAMDKF